MKIVFEASTGIEAHMMKNLLALEGIESEIIGEHLQGGVGDLQAIGIVKLAVQESDYPRARDIIAEWDAQKSAEPTDDATNYPIKSATGFGAGVIGFVLGSLLMLYVHHNPKTEGGIDYNNDGQLDEQWIYHGNALHKFEQDRNRDGKMDLVNYYKLNGNIKSTKQDENFDGRFEGTTRYHYGNPIKFSADIDGDGFDEYRENYQHGTLASISLYDPTTKKIKKKQHYQGLRLVSGEIDRSGDGEIDTRYEYDQFDEIIRSRPIK